MNKQKVIGVCLSKIYYEHQSHMIKSLCENAGKKNIKLLVFSTIVYMNENPDDPEQMIFDAVNFDLLDGIILTPDYIRSGKVINALAKKALEKKIPVVILDSGSSFCDLSGADGCYSINFDFTTSFEQVVRHVFEYHKCKKVNFIAAYKDNPYSEARLDCYKKVMAELNIPFDQNRVYYGNFEEEYTYVIIKEMMAKGEVPEAIICANDEMALAACNGLYNHGIKSPQDIIVTGFDGVLQEEYHTPRLTTCFLDWNELTEDMLNIFIRIYNGEKPEREIIKNYTLRTGQSCGCNPFVITDSNYKANENIHFRKLRTNFSEKMFASSNKISISRSYEELFDQMEKEMHLIKCKTFRYCLLDGFMEKEFSESALFSNTEGKSYLSASVMNMTLGWKNGKRMEPCKFPRKELLLDMEKIIEDKNESHLFFLPLSHNHEFVGYVSIEFDIQEVDFGNIYNYITLMNSNIGFVKSNHDMFQAISKLKYMYIHDMMTELYNRRGFYTLIDNALSENEKCTHLIIFSIDLDGMKYINDNFGHHEGDNAIKVIADGMQTTGKKTNAINARFGGDEFISAVLTESPEQTAHDYHYGIINYINDYNHNSGKPYQVQLSIGYAYERIKNFDKNIDNLIKNADTSMYHDKKNKKSLRISERVG